MKPTARSSDLLIEELDEEVVIYDQRTSLVHHLDERARRIWIACDGHRSANQIARDAGCDQATIELTLDRLHDAGLLLGPPRSRLRSRRQILRTGAALAVLPAVATVTAPTPAMAQSPVGPPRLCGGKEVPGTQERGCSWTCRAGIWNCGPASSHCASQDGVCTR